MVAGARYIVEKKIPGGRIDYKWFDEFCLVTATKAILFAAA